MPPNPFTHVILTKTSPSSLHPALALLLLLVIPNTLILLIFPHVRITIVCPAPACPNALHVAIGNARGVFSGLL